MAPIISQAQRRGKVTTTGSTMTNNSTNIPSGGGVSSTTMSHTTTSTSINSTTTSSSIPIRMNTSNTSTNTTTTASTTNNNNATALRNARQYRSRGCCTSSNDMFHTNGNNNNSSNHTDHSNNNSNIWDHPFLSSNNNNNKAMMNMNCHSTTAATTTATAASTTTSTAKNNNNNNNNSNMVLMHHPSMHPRQQLQFMGQLKSNHRHQQQEYNDVDDDDDDEDDDDEEEEEINIKKCLHCRIERNNTPSDIQVRCDECYAYICSQCHWCHEYQANHEIRVCERCDGFYCKNCDEMDQCDDCNEVVCSSCSTLLSCKFCGGGLCEECAIACGRCGIVLCSRDSKFAVECDTCRLSYCLVCLASGSKDACVRCGSRPSKRMEQLVHLRLKSIYKAFKQHSSDLNNSTTANNHHPGMTSNFPNHASFSSTAVDNKGNFYYRNSRLDDDHIPAIFDDLMDDGIIPPSAKVSAAVAVAAAASSKYSIYSSMTKNNNNNSAVDGNDNSKVSSNSTGQALNTGNTNHALSIKDRANRYKEEKAKADAAAAALLAELDEEEEVVKSKNKKKKKKKSKQSQAQHPLKNDSNESNENDKEVRPDGSTDVENDLDGIDDDASSTEFLTGPAQKNSNLEYLKMKVMAKTDHHSNQDVRKTESITDTVDPLENELEQLVTAEDIDGIEHFIESIKGIPGRAILRKNAKKALKRLRLESSPPDTKVDVDATNSIEIPDVANNVRTIPFPAARSTTPDEQFQTDPNGYLQIMSLMHNKPASQCATPGSQHTASNIASRTRASSISSSNGPLKSECIMHVRPLIVGWMIGKGGQRIRDLMEESGARIWIDQDSMKPQDPRILYISGSRKNVDVAVRLLHDLVLKYQPLSSPHTRQATPNTEKAIIISSSGKGPIIPDSSDIPPLPLKPKIKPSMSNAAGISTVSESRSTHTLSCDPRFVPLLIGRRGWTIKNIQDSTGAKVDIDQSVNPRKITISGSEGNVEKAIRMVEDVLSYPHAQLHGVNSDGTNIGENDIENEGEYDEVRQHLPDSDVLEAFQPVDDKNILKQPVDEVSEPPTPVLNTEKTGQYPPSSLIMTGDAKSTISASSSLSSTPELLLSSAPLVSIPLIDVGESPFSPQQSREVLPMTLNGLPQRTFNQISPQSPQPNSSIFHHQNESSFYGHDNQIFQPIQTMAHQNSINTTHPMHQFNSNQHNLPAFLPNPPNTFVPVPNHSHQISQHSNAFLPSETLYGMAAGPVHTQSNTIEESLPVIPGFWNGINVSHSSLPLDVNTESPQISNDNFRLDAAVDFLEHSKQIHSKPIPIMEEINNLIGSSGSSDILHQPQGNTQDPLLGFPKQRDDAQMIDSLFGPPTNSIPNDDTLLPGLQGLSLHRNEASSGLWAQSDSLGNSNDIGLPGTNELLFAGLPPPHSIIDRKTESRFVWGESGN